MRIPSFRMGPSALCFVLLLPSPEARAQEAPLTRSFIAGDSRTYRVHLTVRTEIFGQRTEKIGDVTYAIPLTRSAECSVTWRAIRSTLEIAADGSARIEESLDAFDISPATHASSAGESEAQHQGAAELADELHDELVRWGVPRTLRYQESAAGQLSGVDKDGGPQLLETSSPLLTLWLLRALRPAAALPARPVRIGGRWQEPRAVPLKEWKNATASETGEWLEAGSNAETAVRLHVVQQIYAQSPVTAGEDAGELRLHTESLNTISVQDGGILAASRSAKRELVRVIGPVAGLPQPPRFGATLSAQVEIEGCDDGSCPSPGLPGSATPGSPRGGARP